MIFELFYHGVEFGVVQIFGVANIILEHDRSKVLLVVLVLSVLSEILQSKHFNNEELLDIKLISFNM